MPLYRRGGDDGPVLRGGWRCGLPEFRTAIQDRPDRLHRRLIQLKIEREALKKEDDEGAKKSLAALEDEIAKLEREYADLEDKWKAEKAQVAGSAFA